MRLRIYLGTLVMLVIVTASASDRGYCRLLTQTRLFRETFRALDQTPANLNPVERFVFSLMLTNTPQPKPGSAVMVHRAT